MGRRSLIVWALLCALLCATPALAATPVDIAALAFQWKSEYCTLTPTKTDTAYSLTLEKTSENAYAYGFQRQRLTWTGECGLAVSLTNPGDSPAYLGFHLSQDNWDTLAYPDGTATLLQDSRTGNYTLQFVQNGVLNVPAHFEGRVLLPFATLHDSLGNFPQNLTDLQGFAFTVAPGQAPVTTLTFTNLSFWEEGISQLLAAMSGLELTLSQDEICVPMTQESMVVANVVNGDAHQVTYALEESVPGVSIHPDGQIIIDDTCTADKVTVQATIDQQIQLEETLTLTTVWDELPDNEPLEEYTILDPSHYENIGFFALISLLRTYVHPTQWVVLGIWVAVSLQYALWRKGSQRR